MRPELSARGGDATTSTAILPIYEGGQRACFFTPGVNSKFTAEEIITEIVNIKEKKGIGVGAFIFGYPHLLPSVVKDDGLSKVSAQSAKVEWAHPLNFLRQKTLITPRVTFLAALHQRKTQP